MDENDQDAGNIREGLRVELEGTRRSFHRLLANIPAEDWENTTANTA